ncbi:MAG: glucose-6-phosphate dehydrogenase [Planctomycetota bacterium]
MADPHRTTVGVKASESFIELPVKPPSPAPATLVIFGITGDLARRKLVPALYNLEREGLLPQGLAVLGFSRRATSVDSLRRDLHDATTRYSRTQPLDEIVWRRFAARLDCAAGSYDDAASFASLRTSIEQIDRSRDTRGNRLFYCATPPSAFPPILEQLAGAGLLYRVEAGQREPWSRVVVEKPFGHNLSSARELNQLVSRLLDESQVFRIDHYLGKETVQNILVFRLGNTIFEPLWNRKYVDHIQITAAESIGVEGRGEFYESTGVLRDIVQNHLLEVLSLCTMEPPLSFRADDVRDQKLQVLRALRPIGGDEVHEHVVCAQYRSYRQEPGVAAASRTPTFVAMKLFVDNWRWQGVPIYLRAGKRLARRLTEVAVHFHGIPLCLFGSDEVCRRIEPNVLTLRLQPDEGISLRFASKVPGEELSIGSVTMDFNYAKSFQREPPEAYERLLLDGLRGDQTLFTRSDAVERSWAFITPILEELEGRCGPLPIYEPGSDGPAEAQHLIERAGRLWRSLA